MDVNVTLQEIRDAIARADYVEAGVLFKKLDDWLTRRGGLLPNDWASTDDWTRYASPVD